MPLPSIQKIASDSARTLFRFPLVLCAAAAGTAAAFYLAELEIETEPTFAFSILFAALLGIPFLTGLALFAEKRRWGSMPAAALQALGVLLLAAYAFSLPANIPLAPQIHIIRLLMLAAGLHLFVAVAPWLNRGQVNGFWLFNKTLLLRILTAALFTGVLFAGLALALASVENLFDLDIPGKRYFQLWIVLVGMFTTWFFLGGVPEDLDSLDEPTEYPKGLKIFTQYVLLPLVLIYLVILTAYTGKIIVTWTWPDGWISRLILGFSTVGMLALLLLHPVREQTGYRWIRVASQWFYIVLAPLLIVYFLAVFRRLSEYGMTESRYIAIVTGVWLAAMVLYFLFSRGKNIKAIPLTLCVLSLLITVGPWGAFAVSENSQIARLKSMFEKNKILIDGKVHKAPAPMSFYDAKEISAALIYLHDLHGYEEIQSWFTETLKEDSLGMRSEWKDPSFVTNFIGMELVEVRLSQSGDDLTFEAAPMDAIIISGYDRALAPQFFDTESPERKVASGEASYSLNSSLDTLVLVVSRPGESVETITVPLAPVVDSLLVRYHNAGAGNIPVENTAIEVTGPNLKVKVYCLMLRLQREEGVLKTTNIRIRILYGVKPNM
ncbi:MAG: DUF4153 domain-containing protein [Bacteroidota bacterium]|jgi:hypothetical protein